MTDVYLNPILAACLFKAEPMLGPNITWAPHNLRQAALVAQLPEFREFIARLPAGMLDSIGSLDAGVINEFLERHGLGIRMPPFGRLEFGTAAVLDILVKWTVAGAGTAIVTGGGSGARAWSKRFPAVEMKGANVLVYINKSGQELYQPITNEHEVLMVVSASLEDGMAAVLGRRVRLRDVSGEVVELKKLVFPMINLDTEVDVGWLEGLSCTVGTNEPHVSKALAQAKLRMNELGAHAKAGAAIRVMRGCSLNEPRSVVIDQPFTLAFLVDGQVAVAFHLTQECWKAPA